jgi:hypothetical protein
MSLVRILLLLCIVVDFTSPFTPGVFALEEDATDILHRDRQRETVLLALPTEAERVESYLDRPMVSVSRLLMVTIPRPASGAPAVFRSSGSAPPADPVGDDDH